MIKICSYNIEWFTKLFDANNNFITSSDPAKQAEITERLEAIAEVLARIDADLVGIVEAPNTTTTTGARSTVDALELFASHFGLRCNKAIIGFPSPGQQEIAILFDPAKVEVEHDPGGTATLKNPPFTEQFQIDTDEDGIKELYKHYRPPLEAKVTKLDDNTSFKLMVVHAKSKGIFSNNERLHWEREAQRNRRKLFAECTSIRRRVDEWLKNGEGVVVMGDINDGPGMDFTEFQFARSAVEIVIGDIYEVDSLLRSVASRPKWGNYGWEPSTASFVDSFTGKRVNALIDHILFSQQIDMVPDSGRIWNPYDDDQLANDSAIKAALRKASDHYPVELTIR